MARKVRKPVTKKTDDPIGIPTPDERFLRIREYTKNINPSKEWVAIREWLEDKAETPSELRIMIREAADMAARARDLYLEAKVELKKFENKYRDRMQIWNKEAVIYWETQKSAGLQKQITKDMIEDHTIEFHSDLYLELKNNLVEMEALVESLKSLQQNVLAKGRDMRSLLESERQHPNLPGWMGSSKK